MDAQKVQSSYTPVQAPIPPPPNTSFYSSSQWKTLFSLADAIIPSIRLNENSINDKVISTTDWDSAVSKLTSLMPEHDAETAAQYLEENVSSNPGFRAYVQRIFGDYVPVDGRNAIGDFLNALNSPDQSLIIIGSATPIHEQSLQFREKTIASWDTSENAALRAVYRALIGVVKKAWVINSQTMSQVLGFPQAPVNVTPIDGFPFKFLQFPPGNHPETIETDVVVIGSGCGGGVAAKNLAEAGLRVLVVEKGYSYSHEQFPMAPDASLNLYEEGCALQNDDGTLLCLAGSCFGGGGTVNWSASLQTQEFVRREWAETGLPFFTSAEFQTSLDRVCDRMGVNTDKIRHSCGNNVILDGSRKLGYSAKPVPQNTGNSDHYCGHCAYGCAAGGKKGPIESFLVDAAKAGAVFMEGYHAEKVLFEDGDNKKIAIGVEGIWKSRDSYLGLADNASTRKVVIKAQRVIVSCGALQSPLLLLRSGLTNSHIGKHLRLHPCLIGNAVFDKRTNPWEGSALTSVVNDFESLDGKGHGTKIEALSMMPSMFIPAFPWRDGLDFKLFAAGMSHGTSFITLTRDRNGGRVYADPVDGRLRVDYTVSPFDRQHMAEGIIGCAKIAYVTGAREFHTSYRDIEPWIRPDNANSDAAEGINDASLQDWIAELRRKLPLNPERALFASAHQMSTCRMGADSTTSVVDSNCQVWDTEGLFVVDASVFPSASGVNPMVTNMAIADWATRNIARGMDRTEAVIDRLSHL